MLFNICNKLQQVAYKQLNTRLNKYFVIINIIKQGNFNLVRNSNFITVVTLFLRFWGGG